MPGRSIRVLRHYASPKASSLDYRSQAAEPSPSVGGRQGELAGESRECPGDSRRLGVLLSGQGALEHLEDLAEVTYQRQQSGDRLVQLEQQLRDLGGLLGDRHRGLLGHYRRRDTDGGRRFG